MITNMVNRAHLSHALAAYEEAADGIKEALARNSVQKQELQARLVPLWDGILAMRGMLLCIDNELRAANDKDS